MDYQTCNSSTNIKCNLNNYIGLIRCLNDYIKKENIHLITQLTFTILPCTTCTSIFYKHNKCAKDMYTTLTTLVRKIEWNTTVNLENSEWKSILK